MSYQSKMKEKIRKRKYYEELKHLPKCKGRRIDVSRPKSRRNCLQSSKFNCPKCKVPLCKKCSETEKRHKC